MSEKSPWREIEHEGQRYMIRDDQGTVWIVSLPVPDGPMWVFDGERLSLVPEWARRDYKPAAQSSLF